MTPAVLPSAAGHAGHGASALALVLAAVLLVGYVELAAQAARDPRGWSRWRTASFVTGCLVLGAGLVPELSPWPAGSFPEHMHVHLLIGMYAPLGLALGAPLTLLLRVLPHRQARRLGRLLHTAPVRVLAHPGTALVLNVGGLYALYCTPLFGLTQRYEVVHHLVHVHFLLAGYLFAYAVAGADPAPRRPSVPARLVLLGVAILGHAVLAQLLYAGLLVDVPVPAGERRAGADLMYYAGDIAELLLALAMVSRWRPAPRRAVSRRAGRGIGTARPA